MVPTKTDNAFRTVQIIVTIAMACGLYYVGHVDGSVSENRKSININTVGLATISANRFTSDDGLEVWKEISKIRERLAAVPLEFPPVRFEKKVDKLIEDVQAIRIEIERIKAGSPKARFYGPGEEIPIEEGEGLMVEILKEHDLTMDDFQP